MDQYLVIIIEEVPMKKKNAWFNVVYKYTYIASYLYILIYIAKLIVVYFHSPGAQGGTGGW